MPEWAFDLKITYWSRNEEEAAEYAQYLGELLFTCEEVNSVEAPFAPTWLKDDDA